MRSAGRLVLVQDREHSLFHLHSRAHCLHHTVALQQVLTLAQAAMAVQVVLATGVALSLLLVEAVPIGHCMGNLECHPSAGVHLACPVLWCHHHQLLLLLAAVGALAAMVEVLLLVGQMSQAMVTHWAMQPRQQGAKVVSRGRMEGQALQLWP